MDIVERLRKLVILDEVGSDNPLGREAADEIERLREILQRVIRLIGNSEDAFYYAKSAAQEAFQQVVEPIKWEAADEIKRLREQERKMTNHALDRMEEIERLRDAIADMKRNIRTVDRAFMKESTQEILDAMEEDVTLDDSTGR